MDAARGRVERFEFVTDGTVCRADLYLPADGGPPCPVTVVGPGFGGVKDVLYPPYCRDLADRGIATVSIDFPGFGESEGRPRQHVDPPQQARAYAAALDAVADDGRFDPARIDVGVRVFGILSILLQYTVLPEQLPTSDSTWTTSRGRVVGSCIDAGGYNQYHLRFTDPQPLNEIPLLDSHLVDMNAGLDRSVDIARLQTSAWAAAGR